MKFVCFSDLHIHRHRFGAGISPDTGRHSRLQDCLDVLSVTAKAAIDHKAIARIFCGDLFHVRGHLKPSELNPVIEHFTDVNSLRLHDWMLPGNHDMEARTDGEHALESLKAFDGVQVFEGFGYQVQEWPQGNIGVGWVSYAPDITELKSRVEQVVAMRRTSAVPADVTIFLLHHGVDGAMPGIPDMGFNAANLPTADFDVVLCGDYHNHKQLAPNAWMIGAPLQHNFGDAGQKRGYVVVDIEPGHPPTIEHVEITGVPKFVAWNEGDPIPGDIEGNFVRIRATSEHALELMEKAANGLKPAALQKELVRDFVAAAKADVTLTMTTADMFKTWLDGQTLGEGIDKTELLALNVSVLAEAGVS